MKDFFMDNDSFRSFKEEAYYRFFVNCRTLSHCEGGSSDSLDYLDAWGATYDDMRAKLENHLCKGLMVEDAPAFFEKYWQIQNEFTPHWYFSRLMREIADDLKGGIFFYHWGRDCDLCESDSVHFFLDWYECAEWIRGVYDDAEGAFTVTQIDLPKYLNFERSFRDRGLEQFEEYGYGY